MFDDATETALDFDALTIKSIMGILRQAGAELDRLCLTATVEGRHEAIPLAQASQAVHRALIVLTPPQS